MAFTAKKPPKEGVITGVLEMKNIEIDNKVLMVIDDRLAMVQKMELQIGEVVEYRQASQGVDKGRINFIARKSSQAPVTEAPPAEPPKERPPVRDPVNITGRYVKKAGTTITIEGPEGPADLSADLDVIKILSSNPPKVNAGDLITLQLIDNAGTWVVKKIGPGPKDGAFQTGKDILQQNLEKKKADDAAAAQIKNGDEQAQKRMQENAAYAARCSKCGHLVINADGSQTCHGNDQINDPNCKNFTEKPAEMSKMCQECEHTGYCPTHDSKGGCGTEAEKFKPKAPEGGIDGIVAATRANAQKATESAGGSLPAQSPMEPEKPAPEAPVAAPQVNPGANVTVSPVRINDTYREVPRQRPVEYVNQQAIEAAIECPVELKIHLDCGSYSNFDLSAPAMPIDQSIARIEADARKSIAMMHRLMAASKKGF